MSVIEVVGRACRLPGANSVAEFWQLLTELRCSVTRVPEERFAQSWYFNPRRGEPGKSYTFAAGIIDDIWGFDAAVFSITPREARQMDPQQRLVLQLAWEALEDAGIPASSLARRPIGVYVGASSMDHSHRQYFDPAGTDSYLMTGNTLSLLANRVSYQFDLTGPSLTIDTACSSSLVALDYAVQDLQVGKIDAAIVGGVNGLLSPFNFMGFCAAAMLSPDGLCRAFDHRANGYVRSEGGVIMVLQRKGDGFARNRIHGEILASAMNSDGRTPGVALPSMHQQAALLQTLYESSGIDPMRLAFVEAHGTGTPVGDPVECHALGKVLGAARTSPLPVGSAKSNVGHLEPASGMVGLLKAQLALEHGILPATLHVEALNPRIPFGELNLQVATEPVELADLPASQCLAGVNNFGFGGTNVHVIIGPARLSDLNDSSRSKVSVVSETDTQTDDNDIVLLSAQCRDGLAALAQRYIGLLEDRSALPETVDIETIGNAVAHSRDLMPERLAVVATSRSDLETALRGFVDGNSRPNLCSAAAVARSARTAFVFSGNGAQWAGMGRTALEQSPAFKRHFTDVTRAYRSIARVSLEQLIHAEDLAEQLNRTEVAQPLLFAIQVALAKSLIERGLRPDALIGHSVGEVAAAHIGGALDLRQAASVIRARSRHQEIVRGLGRMAALQASQDDAEGMIAAAGLQDIVVAAINSPRSVTIAGEEDEVRQLLEFARSRQIAGKLLDIQYPFHSPRLDPARRAIVKALSALKPSAMRIPFYSTVAGARIDGTQLDAEYWWRNVREPVRFLDAVRIAARDGAQAFIEIGPRSILRGYITDCVASADHDTCVVPTFEPADANSDIDPVSAAIGRALVAGARFETDRLFGPRRAWPFSLPQYPWQNKAFRMTPSPEALGTFSSSHIQHPLLGARLRGESVEWERQLDTSVLPYLGDHRIGDRTIMPGTGYVEMALAAAIHHLGSQHVQLRDIDFVHALELPADSCQEIYTRVEPDSATISIASRTRLTTHERQTHMRTRFARLPSEILPAIEPPVRQTSPNAPPCADLYRLASRFHLNYGPAFQRMTACREISDDIIEVELSAGHGDDAEYFLHPVDFDACLHGLNVLYKRLKIGESKQSFVPVRIGSLRLLRPHERVCSARIRIVRFSARGAVANFELFARDGALIAMAEDMRFKAASLVNRLKLSHAAYHIGTSIRALPVDSRHGAAPSLDDLRRDIDAAPAVLSEARQISLHENGLLMELAARRVLYDVALSYTDGTTAVLEPVEGSPNGLGHAHEDAPSLLNRHDNGAPRAIELSSRKPPADLLRALDAAGLIHCDETSWRLAPDCALPPVEEIIASILEDDPSWSAEGIMLLNVAERGATISTQSKNEAEAGPDPALHTTATLEHFQSATPRSRAEIAAVAAIVGSALRLAPPMRPFRILQLGCFGPGLTRELLPLLHGGRVHLVVADSDPKQLGRLASLWQVVPGAEFVAIDEDATELRPFGHFDLVVSVNGLSQMPRRHSILSGLRNVLADHALAVISEREPDFFHAVAFGTALGDISVRESALSLQNNAAWKDGLRAAGFNAIQEAGANLAIPGTTLLLAQAAPTAEAALDTQAAHEGRSDAAAGKHPRSIILLGKGTSKSGFEPRLERALDDLGLATIRAAPDRAVQRDGAARSRNDAFGEVDRWGPVIARLDHEASTYHDIVFALDGAAVRSKAQMPALLSRLNALAQLLRSLENRAARVWIIAEGGARAAAGVGSACPVQTGVWAFGRTAMNEFAKLDVRLVDFAEGMKPATKAARMAQLINVPGDLRELVLTADSIVALEVRRGAPPTSAEVPFSVGPEDGDAAVLQQREWGNLEELIWARTKRRPPGADEVEIEVAASGLNFRDVMWSMGLLPEEALENGFAGPTVGLECSGLVVRVGSDVTGLAIGDPVIAIAPACFASHVTVAARAVGRLPDSVGLEEAASIPVAFLTACYGLEHLARLRKNEWVLIHGAAGGVGLAAIQVAKRNGARIIATAGSEEKRGFLRRLGADFVLDTRSLDFVDHVREITKKGVSVVLNSLAGEAMERSIELLRPFGRFIELGKRDFYASTTVSLRPFRNNVSYFGVDADQLLTYEPDVAKQVLDSVLAGFEGGVFSPLPCRIFKSGEALDAFRLMQKSGHIGKIIVKAPTLSQSRPLTDAEFVASGDGYHVVFGGTGGFGLEYARWLADRGARHIVVASRSGGASDELRNLAEALHLRGVSLASVACDVTDKPAVEQLLDRLRLERPIAGVAHTAMVLDDGLITALTPDRIEKVLAPKVLGARNLDVLTRDDDLDYFILFSSAAAMFGNPGQASYVAANGYLDGLARERRERGQKALAVAWGAITDVGVLARDTGTAKSLSRHTGGNAFTARSALDLLAQVLANEHQSELANISLAAMNWGMAGSFLPIINTPAYDLIRREGEARGETGAAGTDLQSIVLSLDETAAKIAVADYLVKEVATIFRMPPEDINPKRSLTDVGMDSLMGLELRMAVERQTGIDIMKVSMSDGTTINDIAEHIAGRLRNAHAEAEPAAADQTLMISQHITEVIEPEELRQIGSQVSAREAALQKGVL